MHFIYSKQSLYTGIISFKSAVLPKKVALFIYVQEMQQFSFAEGTISLVV